MRVTGKLKLAVIADFSLGYIPAARERSSSAALQHIDDVVVGDVIGRGILADELLLGVVPVHIAHSDVVSSGGAEHLAGNGSDGIGGERHAALFALYQDGLLFWRIIRCRYIGYHGLTISSLYGIAGTRLEAAGLDEVCGVRPAKGDVATRS